MNVCLSCKCEFVQVSLSGDEKSLICVFSALFVKVCVIIYGLLYVVCVDFTGVC